jgi:hypothetical protein
MPRIRHGRRYIHLGGQMVDDRRAEFGHQVLQGRIPDVHPDQGDVLRQMGRGAPGEVIHHPELPSGLPPGLHQMGSDEPRAPGDQNPHGITSSRGDGGPLTEERP